MWALENSLALGWSGKRIVVVGDSAGGNLCLSLTLRCVLEGVRTPDAVMAFYPALNVNLALSASRMLASMDTLLNHGVLETCLAAYSGQSVRVLESTEIKDPLMSPYHAPDHVLQQLPFTVIVALENDPLLDDSLAFALRLRGAWVRGCLGAWVRGCVLGSVCGHTPHTFTPCNGSLGCFLFAPFCLCVLASSELGVAHKLLVFPELPHGFLNFKDSSRASQIVFEKTMVVLKQLI